MEKYKKDYRHYIKLIINSVIVNSEGCWVWQKALNSDGYSATCYNGRQVSGHILSKIVFDDYIEGLVCDHICRNRACVNPDHIRMVTTIENIHEKRSLNPSAINLRKEFCINGHRLNDDNIYVEEYLRKNGNVTKCRRCRLCRNLKEGRRRKRLKAV